MKRNAMFLALLFTAFLFPSIGSVSNADALGNYGCGNPDKKTHVNCLRGLLSSTPHGLAVQQSSPSNDGLGNYGCGNRDKRTHVNCLRGLLDQHGAHLQVGNRNGGPPPGDHPDCPAGTTCGGPNDHHGGSGDHPDCPAGTTCGGPPTGQQHHGTNNQGDPSAACAAMHPGGAGQHTDPPEARLRAVENEYAASCQAGACSLSAGTYASLESLGHSRAEIDCFLAAGERQHNEEHGETHPPAGNP